MSEVVSHKKKKTKGKINAPFGYFGSKNKIALQLCSNLPPHNCWVEAFCGSAALTLAKAPAPIEVINDIDDEIVNFFKQLRKNPEKVYRDVLLTPYAETELINARKPQKRISDLERARLFLAQAMMAINGAFGQHKGGFSYSNSYVRNGKEARVSRWYNLPERLEPVLERLKNVRVECKDARRLIEKFVNRPATLIYLDPPYFADRLNGYSVDAKSEDFHRELLTIAAQAKCMIFISGYKTDLYESILSPKAGWTTHEIKTHTKGSTGDLHDRLEVVWTNKHFQKALKTGKVPIELTATEVKQKKINPERL